MTMMEIKLSICIPTYNFGTFIGETLHSVLSQTRSDIEVIVLDGGSTDNTREIVERLQKTYSCIKYIWLENKGGIDKDLSLSVEKAGGEYCWLLSSDDLLEPGSIQMMINEIRSGQDIYLCNRLECDINLNPIRFRKWLSNNTEESLFQFEKSSNFVDYFDRAQSLGALFSFMSSIIVSREKWIRTGYNELFSGSNYAHVFRLFTMLKNHGTLKYIKSPLVKCRTGNDSFLDRGMGYRFLIDLKGYQLLAEELFNSEPTIKRYFISVMQRQHPWYGLIRLKCEKARVNLWNELESRFLFFGYSRMKLRIVSVLGSFSPVCLMIPFLKKLLIIKRKLFFAINHS
jgi:abequosyltransferase